MKKSPSLTITPEVAAEFIPGRQARKLIRATTQKYGCTEAYGDYQYGSAYYVELPRYVQHLIDKGRMEEAEEMLDEVFNSSSIPDSLWRRMVALGEKRWGTIERRT